MPAINIPMYIPQTVPLFINSMSYPHTVKASKSPVGINKVNPDASWYVNVDKSRQFWIYVPLDYVISEIYTYNDNTNEWEKMNWTRVPHGSSYTEGVHYMTDDDTPGRYLGGYRAYIFSDHDIEGEEVQRSFPLSFNIAKNE